MSPTVVGHMAHRPQPGASARHERRSSGRVTDPSLHEPGTRAPPCGFAGAPLLAPPEVARRREGVRNDNARQVDLRAYLSVGPHDPKR